MPLARITSAIKGVSARDANAALGRVGKPFWQDESFDHWVRSSAEGERIKHYIEWDPVKAGLATKPEDWRWSSACPEVAKVMARLAQPGVAVPLGHQTDVAGPDGKSVCKYCALEPLPAFPPAANPFKAQD
jgi:hypothetical protein